MMRTILSARRAGVAAVSLDALVLAALPSDSAADPALAKKLANPIAALVSLPLQFNHDDGIGPEGDGSRFALNVQPVIPFSIGEDWNLISRTIVPLVRQDDVAPGPGS